ncbi:hypothetical protein NX722_24995 [Endozoicomonas gorgoniicola]|uniref:Uncharacterized protein n=1 Tax=Endozoicomonas gorgoniicola TaxID=1234144 RepID=A0ABT3N3P4_9GAMM|nr:hypothetical protein [Endozoicomonas gorgoniicola]MCW7555824.1 hypothetical protein [Endozoicomonas gorgoniicola]
MKYFHIKLLFNCLSANKGARLWLTFLRLSIYCLTIFSQVAYSDEVFCFTDLGGGTCDSNEWVKTGSLNKVVIGNSSDYVSIDFRFRAFDDDESEEWELEHRSLRSNNWPWYSRINESDYTLEMTSPKNQAGWPAGESGKISGGNDDGDSEKYYSVKLNLAFKDHFLNGLQPGDHTFLLPVLGRIKGNLIYTRFFIWITIELKNRVKISGLENVAFGTFLADDFSRSHSQTFCAHVQGGGNFKLMPTTDNGAFKLKGNNTGDSIDYSVYLANVGDFPKQISYGEIRRGLRGDASENCTTGGGENMQLKIELPEISILSVKPADIYMDTLTLTIEAD